MLTGDLVVGYPSYEPEWLKVGKKVAIYYNYNIRKDDLRVAWIEYQNADVLKLLRDNTEKTGYLNGNAYLIKTNKEDYKHRYMYAYEYRDDILLYASSVEALKWTLKYGSMTAYRDVISYFRLEDLVADDLLGLVMATGEQICSGSKFSFRSLRFGKDGFENIMLIDKGGEQLLEAVEADMVGIGNVEQVAIAGYIGLRTTLSVGDVQKIAQEYEKRNKNKPNNTRKKKIKY